MRCICSHLTSVFDNSIYDTAVYRMFLQVENYMINPGRLLFFLMVSMKCDGTISVATMMMTTLLSINDNFELL